MKEKCVFSKLDVISFETQQFCTKAIALGCPQGQKIDTLNATRALVWYKKLKNTLFRQIDLKPDELDLFWNSRFSTKMVSHICLTYILSNVVLSRRPPLIVPEELNATSSIPTDIQVFSEYYFLFFCILSTTGLLILC